MDLIRIFTGWLIDGSGGPILDNVLVEIAGDRILKISEKKLLKEAPGEILDFSGCTLIPGLVDCHVHLCMSGATDRVVRERQLVAGFDEARNAIERHLKRHLASGVIAVRDGGDHYGFSQRFKAECGAEKSASPVRICVAGKAWHAPGRYGGLIGRPPENGEPLARAILRECSGIDHVKIVNSGVNSLMRYGKQTLQQFSAAALQEAAVAAKSRGLPVMVHANGVQPVGTALSAGIQSVEHGFFMGKENLDRMRDKEVTWAPTAFAMEAFTDPVVGYHRVLTKSGGASSPASIEAQIRMVAQKTLDHQVEQIRYAREKGVKIAVGTDSGSIGVDHGVSFSREIALLMESGFSIQEAIHCAARVGARLLRLEDLGLLAVKKEATFAAVRGGPHDLPGSLSRITALYVKGKSIPLESPAPESSGLRR